MLGTWDVFESNLLRIGRMVALLDDWDAPQYLTRIWTIFEQFTAIKLNIPVQMIMPADSNASLNVQINRGEAGIIAIKKSLSSIDSAKAEASRPSDREKVLKNIRESVGFEKVDECVKESMFRWIGHVVVQRMRTLGTRQRNYVIRVRSSTSISTLLLWSGVFQGARVIHGAIHGAKK